MAGQTGWPDNVRLFQPYEVGQILMYDFASCLGVKTFLNMAGLKFQTELRSNAEFMSPSGKLPLLQLGPLIVSEFEPIVAAAAAKGYSLSADLTQEQRAEMKAYVSLVQQVFVNAQLYIMWCDKETRNKVTKPRYGSPFKWPLSLYMPFRKYYRILSYLDCHGWARKSEDEVFDEVQTCCKSLSEKLGSQPFFFGSRPTELDALVFGHLYTALTTQLLTDRFADTVRSCSNLVDFCRRIHDNYFSDLQKDGQ
jgi:metaxin